MKIKPIIHFLLFTLLFLSCEANIDINNISKEVSLHPDLIIPIGGANLSLGEFLSKFGTNGSVTFGINNEVDYVKLDIYLKSGSFYKYNDSILNIFKPIASNLDKYSLTNINSAALVLSITNGLPVKSVISLKFVDSLDVEIPTSFQKNYTIQSGKVDSQGLVQPGNETKQTLTISLTKDQLLTLRKAKKILYSVQIDGNTNDTNIQFTKNNTFDIKVGLFIKGDLNTNLGVK